LNIFVVSDLNRTAIEAGIKAPRMDAGDGDSENPACTVEGASEAEHADRTNRAGFSQLSYRLDA
jgi:hypothetical protein